MRSQLEATRKPMPDPEIPVLPLVDVAVGEEDEDDEERVNEDELPGELFDAGEFHL
jgi:hypothetical protein